MHPRDARRCQSGAHAPPEAGSQPPVLRVGCPRHCSGGCHRGTFPNCRPRICSPGEAAWGHGPALPATFPGHTRPPTGRAPGGLGCPSGSSAPTPGRRLAVLQFLSQGSGRPRTRLSSLDRWTTGTGGHLCSQSTPPPPLTPLGPWRAWPGLGRVPPTGDDTPVGAARTRGRCPGSQRRASARTCVERTLSLGHTLACPRRMTVEPRCSEPRWPTGFPEDASCCSGDMHVSSGDGSDGHVSWERRQWKGKPIRTTRPGGHGGKDSGRRVRSSGVTARPIYPWDEVGPLAPAALMIPVLQTQTLPVALPAMLGRHSVAGTRQPG